MRKKYDSICRAHEASLHKVCPEDATHVREIPGIPDSIVIRGFTVFLWASGKGSHMGC